MLYLSCLKMLTWLLFEFSSSGRGASRVPPLWGRECQSRREAWCQGLCSSREIFFKNLRSSYSVLYTALIFHRMGLPAVILCAV